ncbi:MAG: glucose-1-phosphate adenylyltransferase subunit GlgD [Clostridiales bacterium]|jgi:glucose-1-phosphate adenylyltransferase|nr:glucose-1-phosphate adenylyltransferase subunit GlgD [Clostridiales bacterium]
MKAIGIVLAGGKNEKLGELTKNRALAAMPVGGCYRCLDFALSSLSSSGVGKIAVMTQYNSRSLHDHLSSSKWWDLGRKHGGLFIFSPYQTDSDSYWFRGTADSIYQNISFLKRSNEQYVVISSGDIVYKLDFNTILERHEKSGADITIVYKEDNGLDTSNYGVLTLDENENVVDFEEKPLEPQTNLISTGIYVIQRTLLIKLLEIIIPEGRYDIVKDIFIRYRKRLKITGFKFEGYWRAINTIDAYFSANMDFLKKEVRDLFTKRFPYIETKPKDEPPAKYNSGAVALDCLVGSGSIINSYILHSILFRKIYTGENSKIINSIIMERSLIGNNCYVENAIIDKEVVLSDGKEIIGAPGAPVIISKGSVI